MSILFYKKPDLIQKEGGPLSKSNCQKYVERAACSRAQIPPELSWDNVMEGKTLPPCSISDFLDYTTYISHDAENLQFWLWMRDYTKRFNALPAQQKRLSPRWVSPDQPVDIPPPVPPKDHVSIEDYENDMIGKDSYHRAASENEKFARQPFRREISQITAHYILPGAPRELNISHKDRSNLLATLSKTTHPSAFAPILELTTLTLRNHSHPNFIRWSICNGNKPRVVFLRGFAIFMLSLGCIISLLLILSNKSRWARLGAAPFIWFGTVNIVAAARGLCVMLFMMSTREAHPWELETPGASEKRMKSREKGGKDGKQLVITLGARNDRYGRIQSDHSSPDYDKENALKTPTPFEVDLESLSMLSGRTLSGKLDYLGPSNNYEGEAWVSRWKKMAWAKKIHIKKVWVKEQGLRILQNKIVIQAHLWGIIVVIPVMAGVVACPVVGLY